MSSTKKQNRDKGSEYHLNLLIQDDERLGEFIKKMKDKLFKKELVIDIKLLENKKTKRIEFSGIDFIQCEENIKNELKEKFPAIEWQQWDAVFIAENETKVKTYILVEAKSHKGEMRSRCEAGKEDKNGKVSKKSEENRKKIEDALDKLFKVIDDEKNYMNKYYQYANRYYTVNFLNDNKIEVLLVYLYFLNDECWKDCFNSEEKVSKEIKKIKKELGFEEKELEFDALEMFKDKTCDIFQETPTKEHLK